MVRYSRQEWLNFITSESHKGFSPLFDPATPEDCNALVKGRLTERLNWVNEQLEGKAYLMGEHFTVADAYLFTVTHWSGYVGIDISGLAHLGAFMGRVAARPPVQEALKAEGLSK